MKQTNEDNAVQSRVITQRVVCEWRRAYALAADPARLPDWASGLAKSALVRHGDHWVAPEGVPEVYLPFRVIGVAPGACEFQFTLLRQPHMDDAAFERDAAWVARDLLSLRHLLEAG